MLLYCEFSFVASRLDLSTRPLGKLANKCGSILTRTVFIGIRLTFIGFPGGNYSDPLSTMGIDHEKHPPFVEFKRLVAIFAVNPESLFVNQSILIQKCSQNLGKVKSTH